jgi:arginine decarboxylase
MVLNLFNLGYCSLSTATWRRSCSGNLLEGAVVRQLDYVPRSSRPGIDALGHVLLQLLIFQSMPDAWAIDHLFPIMPIHRLGEDRRAADPGGHHVRLGRQGGRFIDKRDVKTVHELHRTTESYYLASFLVAYQEVWRPTQFAG